MIGIHRRVETRRAVQSFVSGRPHGHIVLTCGHRKAVQGQFWYSGPLRVQCDECKAKGQGQ